MTRQQAQQLLDNIIFSLRFGKYSDADTRGLISKKVELEARLNKK